jgi:hypothetical protein
MRKSSVLFISHTSTGSTRNILQGKDRDVINLSPVGSPLRADLWYGRPTHLYTVSIHNSRFDGLVHIEGSLIPNPGDSDWYDIITPVPFSISTINGPSLEMSAKVASFGGIHTWIRARLEASPYCQGTIDRILINM